MLRAEKISYEIKGRKVLKDVSFQLRKGEVLALLGANGAGKSTLMRLLSRELPAGGGVIELFGKDIRTFDVRELSKCRAMLNQQNNLSLAFTVREIVMMGRYPHFKSRPTSHDAQIVDEVMEVCGIDRFADRIYLSLSGGEQQRVQLARVLSQIWDNPDSLLLLDEPIAALDLYYQQKVLAIAKALSRRGFMVVVVLHDVNFAASYADRILMLKNGRKLFDGTPIEVLNKQDIYTVFSVDTEVNINVQTLKPSVQLREMILDVDAFNSTLACRPDELSLSDRIKSIVAKNPYVSYRDLIATCAAPALDVIQCDARHTVMPLMLEPDLILQELLSFGRLDVTVGNRVSQLTRGTGFNTYRCADGTCTLVAGEEEVHIRTVDCRKIIAVENHNGRSFRFFNASGEEICAIVVGDRSEEITLFKVICQKFSEATAVNPILPKEDPNSLLLGEVFSKITPNDGTDTLAHFIQAMHAGMHARLFHLEEGKVEKVQRRDMAFLKKILNNCVQHGLPIGILTQNVEAQYQHVGVVQNLIDQGDRYILRSANLDLTIYLPQVYQIWSTIQPVGQQDLYNVELFDAEKRLMLQFSIADDNRENAAVWKGVWGVHSVLI